MQGHDQRERGHGGDEAATGGGAPGKRTRSERIYRRAAGPAAPGAEAAADAAGTSGGAPLPEAARGRFEASVGADLAGVRVHTGAASAQAADALGARAFATGQDIHFAAGQYQPDDPFGLHLLAHEVAHTVQQRGGDEAPRAKRTISEPGDAAEVEADRAADAMVRGAPVAIGAGPAVIARAPADDGGVAAPAAAAAPVWVEFERGEWSPDTVLATLGAQVAVPAELEAAIRAGAKATARFCVALRDRVTAAGQADPARAGEVDAITRALTSRVTELVYATAQSPLTYAQLADVARWAAAYPSTGAAPATPAASPEAQPGAPAAGSPADAAAEAFAATLVVEHARPRNAVEDAARDARTAANTTTPGAASGDPALAGYTFVHDPFDNTVVAIRGDGSGVQLVYEIARGDGDAVTATRVGKVELDPMRVKALARMDQVGNGEKQESAASRDTRLANDRAYDAEKQAAWRAANPAEAAAYDQKVSEARAANQPPPAPPKGFPAPRKTTACNLWPDNPYTDATGNAAAFTFTPPTQSAAWHGFTPGADGPRPGDVYWLWDLVNNRCAHVGVVRSRTPLSEQPGYESWTVVDGGQGGYANIQMVQERSRGPFNTQTGLFASSLADAGQEKGTRRLHGWIDIEAYRAEQAGQGTAST